MTIWGVVNLILWVIIILLIIGFIVAIIMIKIRYPVKFRCRELINGRTRVKDVKARITVDKKNRPVIRFLFKLFGTKEYIVPPPEAIDTDTKGRSVVEAYYIANQGFKYIEVPTTVSDKMNPIDIDDRDFLINQYERADKERGVMWSQYIPLIATISVLLIVTICFIVFFGEIAQPFLDAQDKGIEILDIEKQKMQIEKEIIFKLDDIINDKQREQVTEG